MRRLILALLLVQAVGQSAAASHLAEAEVLAMEQRCTALRQEKLAPEKAAVLRQCLGGGEDREACRQKAADYGEMQAAPVYRPAKYSDLPECVDAYKARKHYDLNPGR